MCRICGPFFRLAGLLDTVDLGALRSKTIVVDASVLLHFFCCMSLAYLLSGNTCDIAASLRHFHEEMLAAEIVPIYIFDGARSDDDLKSNVNADRAKARQVARDSFIDLHHQDSLGYGDAADVPKRLLRLAKSAYATTRSLMNFAIDTLGLEEYSRDHPGRPCVLVASGEADGLLADFVIKKVAWAVATIDSDIIVAGVRVINLRATGGGLLFPSASPQTYLRIAPLQSALRTPHSAVSIVRTLRTFVVYPPSLSLFQISITLPTVVTCNIQILQR